jgi:hypothetical protein
MCCVPFFFLFLRRVGMEDPSVARQSKALIEALAAIDKACSGIRRSTSKVVSMSDVAKERKKVRNLIETCTHQEVPSVHDALRFFDRYLRLHPDFNRGLKLANEAKTVLNSYQLACDTFYAKCCDVEAASRRNDSPDDSGEELTEKVSFLDSRDKVSQRHEFEANLHDEIVAERNKEVREIAESVRDIHEIFLHINELVGEQGSQLEVIDGQIAASEAATRSAANQLRMARDAQDKSRRNQVVLLVIVIVVVGLVVAVMAS